MQEHYQRPLYTLAFLFAVLSLGPALAHLLELPNKIGLPRDQYFTVQMIYNGWALLGIVIFGALLSMLALAIALRGERGPMIWAAVAFLCIVGAQLIFWTYTYPANVATENLDADSTELGRAAQPMGIFPRSGLNFWRLYG